MPLDFSGDTVRAAPDQVAVRDCLDPVGSLIARCQCPVAVGEKGSGFHRAVVCLHEESEVVLGLLCDACEGDPCIAVSRPGSKSKVSISS